MTDAEADRDSQASAQAIIRQPGQGEQEPSSAEDIHSSLLVCISWSQLDTGYITYLLAG